MRWNINGELSRNRNACNLNQARFANLAGGLFTDYKKMTHAERLSPAEADEYFLENINGHIWTRFSSIRRAAAVRLAQGAFERELGRAFPNPEAPEAKQEAETAAVFEQALWILGGSGYADSSAGDSVAPLLDGMQPSTNDGTKSHRDFWSPDALRILGWRGNITVRG